MSEQKLRQEIKKIVKELSAKDEALSLKTIRELLEKKFKTDLNDKKKFIKTVVNECINEDEENKSDEEDVFKDESTSTKRTRQKPEKIEEPPAKKQKTETPDEIDVCDQVG